MSTYEKEPIANDMRRSKRKRQLGESPSCVLCGFDDFDALIPVERSMVERHHVIGRVNDDALTVPLCRNCHASISEAQRDMGIDLRKDTQRSLLEKLIDILHSLADFFFRLGTMCQQFAIQLAAFIKQLDTHCPTWRTMPGAC